MDGTYLNLGSCPACDSLCQTCEDSDTKCLSCDDGYYLDNNSCILCDD